MSALSVSQSDGIGCVEYWMLASQSYVYRPSSIDRSVNTFHCRAVCTVVPYRASPSWSSAIYPLFISLSADSFVPFMSLSFFRQFTKKEKKTLHLITSSQTRVRCSVTSMSVYLCICLSACVSQKPHTAELHRIFVHVDCGHESVLFWRR